MRVIQMNPSSKLPQALKIAPQPEAPSLPCEPKIVFDMKKFKKDDWILLGIIAALIFDGSDDYLLLCALGYLFLAGL